MRFRLIALALAAGLSTPLVVAGGPSAQAERAQALLDRAVAHFEKEGDRALAAFSRSGEFTEGELYVYVLDNTGTLLASGGASYTYIGRNMLEYRDPDGKALFLEILDGAKANGKGRVQYRWLNLQRNTVERKVAYYRAVGERILAVGYYTPRATQEQALSVLWRAVDELKRHGNAAFETFNDINGGFVRDDTYVFVVGLEDKRMHAHGAMPRLVGRRVGDLTDVEGTRIVDEMLAIVERDGEGQFSYRWRNPATGQIESKTSFLRRVGDYMVAVGYYQP